MAFDEKLLNGISVLSAIIDSGSFAGAGDILDMSQSGVSRAVARLEARLGVRMFDRTTRSVSLTDEGRRFYEQILPLLTKMEEVTTSLATDKVEVRGRLRVTVDPFFSRLVLGPQLGAFIAQHPGLHLEIMTRHQLGDMVADGFDLALRFGNPRTSSLIASKLFDTNILTVASPAYIQRHGRPQTPQDLVAHACIQFRDPETGRPFEWEFHTAKEKVVIPVSGPITVNDAGTLHSVCLAGVAIAQTMSFGISELLAEGRLVNLFPDWSEEQFPLYALYPSRAHMPLKTSVFLDFVRGLKG
ncbi:LysR family transcriptional regulator [Methylophilus sp. 14]|uniref:LysR family transcriptional regulator n=1 Tax=Methylophilus sp. 14 TaxID=2781019 RepID=UPI00188F12DB|nr:LysR family transcriptional regulator [Methylophilus sp. 14]